MLSPNEKLYVNETFTSFEVRGGGQKINTNMAKIHLRSPLIHLPSSNELYYELYKHLWFYTQRISCADGISPLKRIIRALTIHFIFHQISDDKLFANNTNCDKESFYY